MSFRRLAPLVWTLVLLAALELALEFRATRNGWPTLLFPGASGESAANDDLGPRADFPFRSRRIAPDRRTGVARIWFASASYAEDPQQRIDDVFPARAATLLNERGLACEALNASASGHTIAGNVRDLERFGERWRSDVIVLYQMSNDIDNLSTALCARGWRSPHEPGVDAALLGATAVSEPHFADKFVESTTLYKHLKSAITARVARGRALAHTLGAPGEELFELRVRAFLGRCRELGATPVLCTFPTAYTSANVDQTPREYELNLLRFNVHLALAGWLDSVERFNAVLRRVAQSEGVALIDAAERFAGRAELFRDMWHFTARGHDELAQQLADELARLPRLAEFQRR